MDPETYKKQAEQRVLQYKKNREKYRNMLPDSKVKSTGSTPSETKAVQREKELRKRAQRELKSAKKRM